MLRVVGQSTRPDESATYLHSAQPVRWAAGFFDEEIEDHRAFRWMGLTGRFEFESSGTTRHLEFSAYSSFYDLSQVVEATCGEWTHRFDLTHGWMQLSLIVPPGATSCDLGLSRPFPPAYYPDDSRTLGIQVRDPLLHSDSRRHEHVARQHANGSLNRREMLAGANRLESTPPVLGIDMYGICNVKPPCVYCEWDWNKELEGANVEAPFDDATLAAYGEFFDNSYQLVNCSIGEPFMMKNFDGLLETFGRHGKVLELTTNGQILTDRNIERLVGRPIDLYISLDAGTPETYAKLRNDRFEDILDNLRRLNKAKGGRLGLPRIRLVFMPMRVNQHELEDFVKICAEMEVERMVLRPLNYSDSVTLNWERSGYTFDYQNELLPFERLVELSAEAARLAAHHGVPLADQMDFGSDGESFAESFDTYPAQAPAASSAGPAREDADGAVVLETPICETAPSETPPSQTPPPQTPPSQMPAPQEAREPLSLETPTTESAEPLPSLGGDQQPLCLEPWRSLYILRRGTMPCCYGGEPVADFDGYREAWNGPAIVHIRETLAAGRFPQYCLNSPACPIVRKHQEAGEMPVHQRALLRARRSWFAFERATDEGWRRALAWPLRSGVRLVVGLIRHPRRTLANIGAKFSRRAGS